MAVQPQAIPQKKRGFDKVAAIGTVCVGVGGAAAALALKSSVDAQGKRLGKLEEQYAQTADHADMDELGRIVRSLERRIDYLEGVLEQNGISVTSSVGRRNDTHSYVAPSRAATPSYNTQREGSVISHHTQPASTPPPRQTASQPLSRPHPTRGELMEKSEQELESTVDADIY